MPKVVTADVFTPLTEFSCIISSVTTTNEGAKVGCAHDALCQFYVWGFSQPHILLSLRVIKWPMTSRGGDRLHGHPVFTYGSFLPPCSQLYNSQLTERGEGHKGEICTGHGGQGTGNIFRKFRERISQQRRLDGSIQLVVFPGLWWCLGDDHRRALSLWMALIGHDSYARNWPFLRPPIIERDAQRGEECEVVNLVIAVCSVH